MTIQENEISCEFDEVDPNGIILRTLTEFILYDEDNKMVTFEALNNLPRPKIHAIGYVIEPLQENWQHVIIENTCTAQPSQFSDTDSSVRSTSHRSENYGNEGIQNFNREALKTGDHIDGYCTKTFKWYEAKIIDTKRDADGGDFLKVHFLGWKNKFDEWINRFGERIAALGQSALIISKAQSLASKLIPWYEHDRLYNLASKTLGAPIPQRNKVNIIINNIEDWCIDYTYSNPSLWLIAESGVWYRIAGLFVPNGHKGTPKQEYYPLFRETYEKFYSAAHCAMCLMDFLPTNVRISLSAVAQEISLRSYGEVSEILLLKHYAFLVEQLSSLSKPLDWDDKIDIPKCTFITQLRKEGAQFITAGGIEGVLQNRLSNRKRYSMALKYIEDLQQDEPGQKSKKGRTPSKDEQTNDNASSSLAGSLSLFINVPPKKIKYPIDDTEFWSTESRKGIEPPLFPYPSLSSGTDIPQLSCPSSSSSFDLLLSTWSNLMNFRSILNIPYLTLEAFETIMMSSDELCSLARELYISLLCLLLTEKGDLPRKILVNSDKTAYADEDEDAGDFIINRFIIPELYRVNPNECSSPTEGELSASHLLSFLRFGDTWLEVTRLLIAEEEKVAMPEALDPLAECESILDNLMKRPEALPFLQAPTVPVTADGLALNNNININEFIGLETIRDRLQSEWYSTTNSKLELLVEENNNIEASENVSVNSNTRVVAGELVDFFMESVHHWYLSEVVSVTTSEVTLQCIKWTNYDNVTVAFDSDRIRHPYSLSSNTKYRSLSPEQLSKVQIEETPMGKDNKIPPRIATVTLQHVTNMTTASRGQGYLGFAEDVRQVWRNCESFYEGGAGENQQYVDNVKYISSSFEQQFEKRVHLPEVQNATRRGKLLSDVIHGDVFPVKQRWEDEINMLGDFDFRVLPLEVRLKVLNWLCNRMLNTQAAKVLLEKISTDRRMTRGGGGKSSSKPEEQNGEDKGDDNYNNNTEEASSKKGKRPRKSNVAEETVISADVPSVPNLLSSSSSKEYSNVWSFHLLGVSPDDLVDLRIKKLGLDRDFRSYWVLPQDVEIPRIFCRDTCIIKPIDDNTVAGGADGRKTQWIVFAGHKSISELDSWLCNKGVRENALKIAIEKYLLSREDFKLYFENALTDRRNLSSVDNSVEMVDQVPNGGDINANTEEESLGNEGGQIAKQEEMLEQDLNEEGEENTQGRRKRKSRICFTSPEPDTKRSRAKSSSSNIIVPKESPVEELFVDTRWVYFANFISIYHSHEDLSISLLIDIDLSVTGQLGLGVIEKGAVVIVTSFKYLNNHSSAKEAGIRIGDRILFAEDSLISSISVMQNVMKKLSSSSVTAKVHRIRVQILRAREYKTKPLLFDTMAEDPSAAKSVDDQVLRDHWFLRSIETQKTFPSSWNSYQKEFGSIDKILKNCFLYEQRYVPSRLLGLVYDVISSSLHPFLVTLDWMKNGYIRWMQDIQKCVISIHEEGLKVNNNAIDSSSLPEEKETLIRVKLHDLYKNISGCLLDFEDSLFTAGNALESTWGNRHNRRKWRLSCSVALSSSQLSLVLNTLFQAIGWRKFASSCFPISKKMKIIPEDAIYQEYGMDIPQENSIVLYYGEGHVESLENVVKNSGRSLGELKLESMQAYGNEDDCTDCDVRSLSTSGMLHGIWGGSSYFGNPKRPLFCKVTSVQFFLCGDITIPADCKPFAQISLSVLKQPMKMPAPILHPPSLELIPRFHLRKRLMAIVNILKSSPDAVPFLYPVSKVDFPDYYTVIANPMSIHDVRDKVIAGGAYLSMQDLENDILLIKTNCIIYCEVNYPDVAEAAHRLFDEFVALRGHFQSQLDNLSGGSTMEEEKDLEVGGAVGDELSQSIISAMTSSTPNRSTGSPYLPSDAALLLETRGKMSAQDAMVKFIRTLSEDASKINKKTKLYQEISDRLSVFDGGRPRSKCPFNSYLQLGKFIEHSLRHVGTFGNSSTSVPLPDILTNSSSSSSSTSSISIQDNAVASSYPKNIIMCAPIESTISNFLVEKSRYFAASKANYSHYSSVRQLKPIYAPPDSRDNYASTDTHSLREGYVDGCKCLDEDTTIPWRWLEVECNSSEYEIPSKEELSFLEIGQMKLSFLHDRRYRFYENPWNLEFVNEIKK